MLSTRASTHFTNNNSNYQSALFPWIRKKQSSWSLYSILKFHSSSLSLPLSVESASSIIPTEEEEEEEEESTIEIEPPPLYDDPSHPWTFQFPKYLLNRIQVVPREEEGREILPEYSCSVDKIAYMHVKCELSKPDVKSKNRSWRDYYVLVYGTQIMAYYRNPQKNKHIVPVWKHSMQGAEVSVASDYTKYRHVIRIRIADGPQYLLTTLTETDKNDWINAIDSSIQISSDLDVRKMPQFTTLFRRRRRQQRPTEST
ncbi:MAG: hypothetical protein EXX96DRAFT_588235 [Benjaminiella poitrasii]|nr:MAG: hypothetical protein EXX96DRAFT_588235 [Benjaminiella poitrasii]